MFVVFLDRFYTILFILRLHFSLLFFNCCFFIFIIKSLKMLKNKLLSLLLYQEFWYVKSIREVNICVINYVEKNILNHRFNICLSLYYTRKKWFNDKTYINVSSLINEINGCGCCTLTFRSRIGFDAYPKNAIRRNKGSHWTLKHVQVYHTNNNKIFPRIIIVFLQI